MKKLLFLGILMGLCMACSNKSYVYSSKMNETQATPSSNVQMKTIGGVPRGIYPNATAFRMSGDYAGNVAVTLGSNGELTYFPAPSDLTAYSEPISLGNGWWLNCQGIGPNSVFTKYTFAEYSALPQTPTPQQIKLAIIPGAKVTQFIELPMKLNDAVNNINEVKLYIKDK